MCSQVKFFSRLVYILLKKDGILGGKLESKDVVDTVVTSALWSDYVAPLLTVLTLGKMGVGSGVFS